MLTIYAFSKLRKIMYIPVNSSFTVKKVGFWESKFYRRVFVMTTDRSKAILSLWYFLLFIAL